MTLTPPLDTPDRRWPAGSDNRHRQREEASGSPHRESVTLPAEPRSAGTARRLTERLCAAAALDGTVSDAAVLLVSEVVTNAITHGGRGARLTVTTGKLGVHVEVGDDNQDMPYWREPNMMAEDGRGIGIVDALATHWGIRAKPLGKVVWFQIVPVAKEVGSP